MGGDGARVLSADSVRRMFLDRVPDPEGDTYYGMGWTSFSWDDGELVLSHDGQVENYTASMCLLPERGIGIVALSDANDNAGGNIRFFDLVGGVVGRHRRDRAADDDAWAWRGRQRVDVLYASAASRRLAVAADGSVARRLSAACRGGAAPIVRAVARCSGEASCCTSRSPLASWRFLSSGAFRGATAAFSPTCRRCFWRAPGCSSSQAR
ncbi:MAG: hypothetical protein ACLSVD_16105 [Eggerthellaceae bacterium]